MFCTVAVGNQAREVVLWITVLEGLEFHLSTGLTTSSSFLLISFYFMRIMHGLELFMIELLSTIYPWVKSLHVISVIAWMAGLFYLPRLFVYHAETVGTQGETHGLFQTMEVRLLRVIMNPAMISTWAFGLLLVATPGVISWSEVWPWTKAAAVIGMTWFHHWCGLRRKDFASGTNIREGRYYRMMNEVPTVFMIVIVVSVIARPL